MWCESPRSAAGSQTRQVGAQHICPFQVFGTESARVRGGDVWDAAQGCGPS